MITFHNAFDTDSNVVHIDEVTQENRAKHYYCIGCGSEMSAVLGDIREHHFRHKGNPCSWESYLHKLGKKRFKAIFDSQKTFYIQYNVEYTCPKYETCRMSLFHKNCYRKDSYRIDLKQQYDTCEEEAYYKGYRADLMLSSREHPEREPLFLEISVSHDCEPEKLASGIKIIELKIKDERDVCVHL